MDAIITIDENERITVFNAAAEKMFGCPAKEAIGSALSRFIPETVRREHGAHVRAYGNAGFTSRRMGGLGTIYGVRSNGEEFPVEASISHAEHNGVKSYTAILRDVTERLQKDRLAQERLNLQEQLTKIAASAPGLIYSYRLRQDGSSHMPYASPVIESIFGFCAGDVAEDISPAFVRIHPDDIGHVNQTIAESARTLQPWLDTFRYDHPTKGERWIEGHSMPQQETEGSILWHGYIHDITERKLAETALEHKERELRLIMDSTPALISYLDTDFRYLRVNKTYENGFCLHQEQILGHTAQEIIGERAWGIVSPFLERARSGERVSFDYQIPYGTGKPRWVHGNYIPDKDTNGNVKGIVVHVVDIDDRKQAELERQKFVSLADNSQEFIGMCEMKFMPFYVNAAGMRLVGLDNLEQALKVPVQEFFFPEDQHFILEEFFPKVLREGRGEVEIRFRHFQTGAALWMIYNVFYITDDQGEPVGFATVSRDITVRKQAEAALHDSQELFRLATEKHLHELQVYQTELEMQNEQLRQATVALETSRSHFVELYDFAPVGYLTLNAEDMVIEANLTATKLLSAPRNQLINRHFTKFIEDDYKDRWHQLFLCLKQQGGSQSIELSVQQEDGTKLFVHLDCIYKQESHASAQLRIALVDITMRTLAELALRESEQRMRLATETTGVGIWEWNVITNQIRWDAQMFRIYGITPTQDGFVDYYTWSNSVLPEDLPKQEAILHDTAKRGGHSTREFRILHADDKEIRHIQAVETVRTNELGFIEWVVGTNLDITELKNTTQALRSSEARLALGVQVAGLALAEVDYATELNHLSVQAAQLFGLGETELIVPRSVVHATFHPEDREELMRRITKALDPAGDGRFNMDHRVLLPDGTERWLRVRKQVFFTKEHETRRPARAILACHDITQVKRASEAIRASETFVRGILNSLPEHIVVLDSKGLISAVNEPWEQFATENNSTPYNVSVGANYLDVCRNSSALGDRYAQTALNGLEALLAGHQQEFVMEYPCPTPIHKLWFLMHAKRVSHNVEGIILSHVDITARKRVEDELRNTQARLALVIEEVNAGYWDWDLATDTLFLSPEWNRQLGLAEDDILLQWDRQNDRLHPDDRAKVMATTENFIAGRQANFELQFRLRHKDGSYRWIHSHGALLRNEHDQPYRMLGLNLDITDYKREKEMNERRDEMEKSFRLYVATQTAAAIAHELNQPLTAIAYYAFVAQKILKDGNQEPKKLTNVIEKCGQQAHRAGDVIQQLLTLLHKGETASEPVDINKSVHYALDIVKSNGLLKSFKIEVNLTDSLPSVMANTLQVQKVLDNLLNNGLEAMQETGSNAGTFNRNDRLLT